MKHAVVVALVALVRVAHADCADPAKTRAAVAKAEKDNAARFDAALKKTKLQPVQLQPTGGKNGGRDERSKNGERLIPLEYPEKSCGGPERAEFVSDGKQVFMVQRSPKAGKVMNLQVCSCDGSPAGCGAVPQITATGYVLPKGMSYGGVKQIEYVADYINVRYGTKQNQPCPQAP